MRFLLGLILICGAALPCLGQVAGDAAGLPKEPREIFAAAAPFYDFNDAALKPWHLKASYQLYDGDGKPTEQGTFEYWWASPQVYRGTWTRPGATFTDWHTADGKHAYKASGEALRFFEARLKTALLSPLPETLDLDPSRVHLESQTESTQGVKMQCIMLNSMRPGNGKIESAPLGLFPTYCFDPKMPVLRTHYSFEGLTSEFNKIVKTQGRFLAREVLFFEEKNKVLSAEVETIEGLAPTDAALTPASDAQSTIPSTVQRVFTTAPPDLLIRKVQPIYPQDAKNARVSGTVVLRAIIGTDGRVHDLSVVSTPWPSLAAEGLSSVSKWEYKPLLVDGVPVEFKTTINVIFTLGG
jgi:TonB family protein